MTDRKRGIAAACDGYTRVILNSLCLSCHFTCQDPNMRKARTGCITCRIRKIKCDEAKPSCRKCVSTGRTCDGYSTLPFSGRDFGAASQGPQEANVITVSSVQGSGLIPRLLSSANFRNVTEKRYFQFFRHCTVPGTNLAINSRFWDRLVLQGCDAEPAIKHAVLTLAAFHNSMIPRLNTEVARQHLNYAENQYQLALAETRLLVDRPSSQQVDRVLIVCVLFVLYEGMRGSYAASLSHLNSGRAIIAQRQKQKSCRNNANEISEMFARLDVFAITLMEATATHRYTSDDLLRSTPQYSSAKFHSINEAQSALMDLLRWMLILNNYIHHERINGNPGVDEFRTLWFDCGDQLTTWRKRWDELLCGYCETSSSLQTDMVELWYTTSVTMLESGLKGFQKAYDSLNHHFARIAELGEKLALAFSKNPDFASFSLDIGFLMPTFFCAIRCRDPHVRRRAIRALKSCYRREGNWKSNPAAAVATTWVQIEEQGLERVETADQVPEGNRISTVEPYLDLRNSRAKLRLTFSNVEGQKEVVRYVTVLWED